MTGLITSVSYTLIDRKANQPTMIMELLEFYAYRNAPPGIQAMIHISPQFALDFASAELYVVAGKNNRAVEHVTASLTSRDYARDVGLSIAGAVGSAATTMRLALSVNHLVNMAPLILMSSRFQGILKTVSTHGHAHTMQH